MNGMPNSLALLVEKVAPGNYAVSVGGRDAFDVFHFRTDRDAQRFASAGNRAIALVRAR